MKHTRGPWNVHVDGSRTYVKKLAGDRTEVICEVFQPEYGGQRANARLLAAAPDLLAACERANKLLSHLMPTVDWGKTFDLDVAELNGVLLDLPAAIAKATK